MSLILVTGGCRSGKSRYAQTLAESQSDKRYYIASCPVVDDEMKERIDIHQQERKDKGWQTIEEELHIANTIKKCEEGGVILIDCLTLWINNLMYQSEKDDVVLKESNIVTRSLNIIATSKDYNGTVIAVTNEVGLGIVPDNKLSRQFRDFSGRCNCTFAEQADEVVFMVSGIANKIKG